MRPLTSTREAMKHASAPGPTRASIHVNLAAIFVSLELSRSTWLITCICSTRSEDGLTLQSCADGLVGVDAAPRGGADDGAHGSVEIGAPCGSEAAGDLAI